MIYSFKRVYIYIYIKRLQPSPCCKRITQNHEVFLLKIETTFLLNTSDKETGLSLVEVKELNARYPKYSHLSLQLKLSAHNLRKLN